MGPGACGGRGTSAREIDPSSIRHPLAVSDAVSLPRSCRNKLRTFVTYRSEKAFRTLASPDDFRCAARNLASENLAGGQVVERAVRLWFLEKLVRRARAFEDGTFLLRDPALERFAPIFHVGWGMDAILQIGYDRDGFEAALERAADPRYRRLAVEPVGVLHLASQTPWRASVTGLRGFSPPGRGAVESFFQRFTGDEIRYISHGLGRAAYFQALTLAAAVRKALHGLPGFDPLFAVQGVAFAYTMVNGGSLPRVHRTADCLETLHPDREEVHFFRRGIRSALAFLEWSFPGLLDALGENADVRGARALHRSHLASGGIFEF